MVYSRIFNSPKQSFFLLGARGTGKTTLLNTLFPEAHFINLLDESIYQSYLGDISLFERQISALPKNQRIVVDEVQRLPAVLNYVQNFIQRDARKFVLTGSSARKLKRGGVNLLAGRALMKFLHPLVPTEIGTKFQIETALRLGTIPIIVDSEDPLETAKAYALTYLSEEIKAESLVKNLPGFSRFLPVAAIAHGQVLNISNIARDCGVTRTTVQGFFEILVDTLMGHILPAYVSQPKVREVRHSKFYFFDPSIVRMLKKQFGPVDSDEKGFLFEGFVHQCLRAYNDYYAVYDALSFWSPLDAKSLEVDFVLLQGKEITAIEVKAKNKLRPDDLKGLKAIGNLKHVKRRFLIYLGNEKQNLGDNITAIPFFEFCKMLARGL